MSIVGMGGLGKTTLAKSVYNDPRVKRSFDIFAWVIISQEYTILEILKRISSEVSTTSSRDTIIDLAHAISEKLKKGKYLIVLDDVWRENVWDQLQKVFPDVDNGSRVIITTRFLNVAKIADPTVQPHELRLLNEKESWELFLLKVFPRQDIETCCPVYLVDFAHQLIQRCRGLPLALVVLGGLMSTKPKSQDAWQKVVESMKWQFVEGGEKCLKILALSYNDLPYYLKSCFLYFGCFREDMAIPIKTLIRWWSAEGFLPTKNGNTTEEIGLGCLEELAQRCLIQLTGRKYDGSAKYCRIHDLLRDMCISEAKENRYLEIYKNDTVDCAAVPNAARRLIIFNEFETLTYSNSKLRGLFYYGGMHNPLTFKALNGQLSGFKLLRVLNLNLYMREFPSEIKSLIHLRYLRLLADNMKEVPSCIGHLHNLQTFIVGGGELVNISDSLWTIESLKHVELFMISLVNPPNMPNIVLKNLQTLKGLRAGSWIRYMLQNFTNLRKLNIKEVNNDHANALYVSLQKLGRLASLTIQGNGIPSDNVMTAFSNQHCLKKVYLDGKLNCKQLPYNDVFPQQLVKLVLCLSQLEQDPMATLEKLPCLKYLKLGAGSYTGKQMICSATGFPQLLFLEVKGCDELEKWKIEKKAMLCLKSLELISCRKLKVIPEGLKNVSLELLLMKNMPEELKSRIEENTGEDWYKIQHVPNISFKYYD
ncbi:probable disease resistance RPP8-like protein 2 [Dioscorea cayenensis subsp. rotundata]|uniref:Probable disease resistance RPP8-like protein 2 n=1 Tax=Dioscorea cayennensis subsp. rotundata TaxID=55577 RepID=A0AB40AVV4_DIOCR|nr:probable disease resistance RPP8-like protein 2 [Dioscorea cayenensis subsp. rotundata]